MIKDRNRTHFCLQECIEDYSELIADILISGASVEIQRTGKGIKVFRVYREKEFCTLDFEADGGSDRYQDDKEQAEQADREQVDKEPGQKQQKNRIKECQIVRPL